MNEARSDIFAIHCGFSDTFTYRTQISLDCLLEKQMYFLAICSLFSELGVRMATSSPLWGGEGNIGRNFRRADH